MPPLSGLIPHPSSPLGYDLPLQTDAGLAVLDHALRAALASPTTPGFGPLTEAVGTEISDTKVGHLLLIGIKVVSDGYSVRERIRVTTERDGVTYRDDLPATLVFCGADLTADECQARYEAEQ